MKAYNWIKHQFNHKIEHLRLSNLKKILKEHGLALLIIIIGWEIVEDIIFPFIFWYMGRHIDPYFFALIPASLLICFHWIAVPFLWGLWIKMSGNKEKIDEHVCSHVCETTGHENE